MTGATPLDASHSSFNRHGSLRQFMPAVLVLMSGIVLSFYVFGVVRRYEDTVTHEKFEKDAAELVFLLDREIKSNLVYLEATGTFIIADEEAVTWTKFHRFVSGLLFHPSGIQALEWIPRVPHSQRESYEAAARRDGLPDFQITERQAQGVVVRAAERDEYFPVYFIEPVRGNAAAVGFDLASEAMRKEALELARDSGLMRATGRITLVQERGNQNGFLVFMPIYRKGSAADTVENRRLNLEGFTLGAFRVGDVVGSALSVFGERGIGICIQDSLAPVDQRLLYCSSSSTEGDGLKPDPREGTDAPIHVRTLTIGGRPWMIRIHATSGFVSAMKTWRPWLLLGGGVLVTLLISAYLFLLPGRTDKIRRFAEDALQAKERLEGEIVERDRVQEALRQSQKRFQDVAMSSADFIWEVDAAGKYVLALGKTRQILGYEPEEIIGRSPLDLMPEDEAKRVGAIFARIAAGKKPIVDLENWNIAKDGRRVLLLTNGVPTLDELGNLCGYRGTDRDITERNNLQQQILHGQKLEAIGRLASGIAHEINTPTQYIGDNVRFLQRSLPDLVGLLQEVEARLTDGGITAENQADLLDKLRKADAGYLTGEIPKAIEQSLQGITHVTKIVSAMRDFSHPSTRKKEPVGLNHLLEMTIAISRNEWKYIADVVTDLESSLPLVPGLPAELSQVFLNLLVNAAQAVEEAVGKDSGRKGTITVTTRSEEGWVETRIADTGKGIPEGIRENIFDPFFTTKDVGKGTGQGLAIARSVVVEKHGGTLTFETEEGKGTTFVIRLPRIDPDSEERKK